MTQYTSLFEASREPGLYGITESELIARILRLKVVFFDCDGVIFPGTEIAFRYQGETIITKPRSVIDGQGISFLRDMGIEIVFITAESHGFTGPAHLMVEKLNNLPSVIDSTWKPITLITGHIGGGKLDQADRYCNANGYTFPEALVMGDDRGDYELAQALKEAEGLVACPFGAEEEIKSIAHIITRRLAGNGAVRDVCNLIARLRGYNSWGDGGRLT